jgi:hypothetical protein
LGQSFTTYALSAEDRARGARLAKKFRYRDRVDYFVLTSLVLKVDSTEKQHQIYQDVSNAHRFYVRAGDAMLTIGKDHPHSPGVGGFSMHPGPVHPDSGAERAMASFIVCINCNGVGVPFGWSTPVTADNVGWLGGSDTRF